MKSWLLNTDYPETLADTEDNKFKFLNASGNRKTKNKKFHKLLKLLTTMCVFYIRIMKLKKHLALVS